MKSIALLIVGVSLGVVAKIGFDRVYRPSSHVLTFEKMYFSDPPPPPYLEDADIAAASYAELELESEIRKKYSIPSGENLRVIISPRLGGYRALVELPAGVALSQAEFEVLVADAKASAFRQWARTVIEFEKKSEGIPPVSAEKLKKLCGEELNHTAEPASPSRGGSP